MVVDQYKKLVSFWGQQLGFNDLILFWNKNVTHTLDIQDGGQFNVK